MIKITIGVDGKPSETNIEIGNKYENLDETIQFSLPEQYNEYNKYLIAYIKNKKTKEEITKVFPILQDEFYISNGLTSVAGSWSIYVMCKQMPVDLSGDVIDLKAQEGEHIFISDGITAVVADSNIDGDTFKNLPMDENIRVVYDDLVQYKLDLEKAEAKRAISEMERKEAEKNRVSVESARVEVENARVAEENKRISNENTRISQENNRKSAENTRVAQENKRQTDTAATIKAMSDTTTDVQNKLNNGDFIPGITVSSVVGTNASVELSGAKANPHFKFTLPNSYTALINKPSINNVELNGNKTLADIGVSGAISAEVTKIKNGTTIVAKAKDSDTVSGFTVGVNVPASAKFTDTVYQHPNAHPATMITEDSNHKFVTSKEKSKLTALPNIIVLTQSEYDALETVDATTLYFITEA